MSLLGLILLLVCIGILMLVINKYAPIDAKIKWLINAVLLVIAVLYVLHAFGVLDSLRVPVPQVN